MIDENQQLAHIGLMTAFTVHQLRLPLSTAMLYTEQLSNFAHENPKLKQWIANIQASHHQMEQQLQDLLLLSRGENLPLLSINLEEFGLKLEQYAITWAASQSIVLKIQNHLKPRQYALHEASFLHALLNLLTNALQSGATCINMKMYHEKNRAESLLIDIEDNGAGMSEEVLEKAVSLFFTTKPSGTGLGLAVVEAVIKAHKGDLILGSSLKGGTCIRIRLP